jgi:peroxiredoxin
MLKVGDAAPDFEVGGTTLHKLAADRSVAVFFFPKVFTPTCTLESRAFGREYETLRKAGGDVVGVSTDPPAESARFCASLQLPYPLVGDQDGSIAKAYGVRWPLVGMARRVTFLVGRDRRIALAFGSERDAEAHVRKIAQALSAA